MSELILSRFLGFQETVAVVMFWAVVAHPSRVRSLWALYAAVALSIVSYAAPMLFTACFPPTFQPAVGAVYPAVVMLLLIRIPVLLVVCSLVLAFVSVAPRCERMPSA
jgi:hypothetical protein